MATGALDANGIWLYGEDDSEPTASALLNKLGNSISDKFDGGLRVASGGTGATTVAAAQDSLRVGLVPISPVSVGKAGTGSTASANALGKVTFAGCTSVSLNGVFSSAYENYRLVINTYGSAVDTELRYRYRAAGVDDSSTNYNLSIMHVRSSGAQGVVSSIQSYGWFVSFSNAVAGGRLSGGMDICRPALATPTTSNGVASGGYTNSTMSAAGGVLHGPQAAYDGITLFPSAGTILGTVQVFGYND